MMKLLHYKIFKVVIIILLFLVIPEVALHLAGFIYTRLIHRSAPWEMISGPARNIMFIGDSWTRGENAIPEPGFSSRTVKKLNEHFPNIAYQECNYAWSGSNSSQAVLQFFDHYDEVKPEIVIILTGANNAWNTQDVAAARRRLAGAIGGDDQSIKITLCERLINAAKKLKLVKLYLLVEQYLDTSRELEEGYFKTLAESGNEGTARRYLVEHYRENENEYEYYDLFRLMRHSLRGDIDITITCLKENGLWQPEKLKGKFDIDENRRYRERRVEILEEQMSGLKQFCDAEGVVMVIQNYPHKNLGFRSLNYSIGRIAKKLDIIYVDHERYFEERVGSKEWSRVLTQGHVDARGHEYMAENLFAVLSDLIEAGKDRK